MMSLLSKFMRRVVLSVEDGIKLSQAKNVDQSAIDEEGLDIQKQIEFSGHTEGYDNSVRDHVSRDQARFIVEQMHKAISSEKEEYALKGLKYLSGYYGLNRDGGISRYLISEMMQFNAAEVAGGKKRVFSEEFVEEVQSMYDEQMMMSNKERSAEFKKAQKTTHLRYPTDFIKRTITERYPGL